MLLIISALLYSIPLFLEMNKDSTQQDRRSRITTVPIRNQKEYEALEDAARLYKMNILTRLQSFDHEQDVRVEIPVDAEVGAEGILNFFTFTEAPDSGEDHDYTRFPPDMPYFDHFDFERYHAITDIHRLMEVLAERFSMVTILDIGRTYEGRRILGVKIKARRRPAPIIFLECGIHAREWIAPATCIWIIHQLVSKYGVDKEIQTILDKYEWRIFPSLNPDGYAFSMSKDRLWRKNRAPNREGWKNCTGTDINRNFNTTNFCSSESSADPCSDVYCGGEPFSELESQALRDQVMSIKDRLKFYFAVHSYSQLWLYPYGYTEEPPKNADELLEISQKAVEAVRSVHKSDWKGGSFIQQLNYTGAGASMDWAYDQAGAKYAFTVELRPTVSAGTGFLLPQSEILIAAREVWEGIKFCALNY